MGNKQKRGHGPSQVGLMRPRHWNGLTPGGQALSAHASTKDGDYQKSISKVQVGVMPATYRGSVSSAGLPLSPCPCRGGGEKKTGQAAPSDQRFLQSDCPKTASEEDVRDRRLLPGASREWIHAAR
jgi:hypothetical protein